jgi:hypothetical protein
VESPVRNDRASLFKEYSSVAEGENNVC